MKLITRDTDYGIRALVYVAKNKDRVVSVRELVEELGVPRAFIRKLMQKLTRKKILCSYKGKNGGFELAKEPSKIKLINLMKIFQGKVVLDECMFKKRVCPNIKTCKLKKKLDRIERKVKEELKSIRLSSLLEE